MVRKMNNIVEWNKKNGCGAVVVVFFSSNHPLQIECILVKVILLVLVGVVGLAFTFRMLHFFILVHIDSRTHTFCLVFKQNKTKWNKKPTTTKFHKCIWLMDEHACAYFETDIKHHSARSTNWSRNRIIILYAFVCACYARCQRFQCEKMPSTQCH